MKTNKELVKEIKDDLEKQSVTGKKTPLLKSSNLQDKMDSGGFDKVK
jgi:translation elongation factor EF-Tu-like GTPase